MGLGLGDFSKIMPANIGFQASPVKQDAQAKFYVQGLDDATRILREDLIIIGGTTGFGKTQLATSMAVNNAKNGFKVCYFALEAFKHEIEFRIKWQHMTQEWYKYNNEYISYINWLSGDYVNHKELSEIETRVAERLEIDLGDNLYIRYRDNEKYSVQNFENELGSVAEFNLLIIDHLHYFDFDNPNELIAIKETIKKIRDLTLIYKVPIVLISHLRKRASMSKTLCPDLDEFHGSSDITKVATKVITISRANDKEQPEPWLHPTYFRICKDRYDGSLSRFLFEVMYSSKTQCYQNRYNLETLDMSGEKSREIERQHMPYWYKMHSF